MKFQAEGCIQARGIHMEHLLRCNVWRLVSQTDLRNSETLHFWTCININ
jgi:hypothetical protein